MLYLLFEKRERMFFACLMSLQHAKCDKEREREREMYPAQEKTKLYSAIGYEENEADLSLLIDVFNAVEVL